MKDPLKNSSKALVIVGLLGAFSWSIAQEPRSLHTAADVSIVQLSLIVTDRSNHSLDDFRQEDIQIIEDGHPRELFSFGKDDRPLNLCRIA